MKRICALLCCLLLASALPFGAAGAETVFTDRDTREISAVEADTAITLEGNTATVDGEGVSVAGSVVTIFGEGSYFVTGTLDDGQLIVDLESEGNVEITLGGASIACANDAAVKISGSKKTVITLCEGTVSAISDGVSGQAPASSDEEASGALYSKDDLTINGAGRLVITANRRDGIACKDSLRIVRGELDITSADDGIVGKDEVTIGGAVISITSGGDGIKSTNDEDEDRGSVTIYAGDIAITSGNDGIQAENAVRVSGGDIRVLSGGGSAKAVQRTGGGRGRRGFDDWYRQEEDDNTESTKGIKAEKLIGISGGSFSLDCLDDALHSNADIVISGGAFDIASGDDGMHADGTLTIEGGDINVISSYEGIEGLDMHIKGGNISVVSSDDGLNAAGGVDMSGFGGFGMRGGMREGNGSLGISGGMVRVDAQGDGIDVNGAMKMSGGEVYVCGPSSSGNGALDYTGSFELTGGTLVAAGSAGMAMGPSHTEIPGVMVYDAGGGEISVADMSGGVVISFVPQRDYGSVAVYSDRLAEGQGYTLSLGGSARSFTASTEVSSAGGFGGMWWQPGGGRRR